jgi:phosphinothricin acetyltransferase
VAESAAIVVGFASYGPFRPWPAYLHSVESSLYVAADRRGRGVGSLLLPVLIGRAAEHGLHTMIAGIDATSEASLRLHATFGFEPVARFREVGWKFDRWLISPSCSGCWPSSGGVGPYKPGIHPR